MSSSYFDVVLSIKGKEVFSAAEAPSAANEAARTVQANALAVSANLRETSVPIVDEPVIQDQLSATATIDLTAAPGLVVPNSATRAVDLTGAVLKAFIFQAGVDNQNPVTIAPGASNGYDLLGNGDSLELQPGQTIAMAFSGAESGLDPVAAGDKNIDVTITGTGTLSLVMAFGSV